MSEGPLPQVLKDVLDNLLMQVRKVTVSHSAHETARPVVMAVEQRFDVASIAQLFVRHYAHLAKSRVSLAALAAMLHSRNSRFHPGNRLNRSRAGVIGLTSL
jgi:hypothetical protein